jgi:hypothetical protein
MMRTISLKTATSKLKIETSNLKIETIGQVVGNIRLKMTIIRRIAICFSRGMVVSNQMMRTSRRILATIRLKRIKISPMAGDFRLKAIKINDQSRSAAR